MSYDDSNSPDFSASGCDILDSYIKRGKTKDSFLILIRVHEM